MKKAKAKSKVAFICACMNVWSHRHNGNKVSQKRIIHDFKIDNNAGKLLSRIQGKEEELAPEFFEGLYREYREYRKELNTSSSICTDTDIDKFFENFKGMCDAEIFPKYEEFSPKAILLNFLNKCKRVKVDAPTMAITAINAFIENADISQTSEREWVISMKR